MSSIQLQSIIASNVARIREQIAVAAEISGRGPADVRLVAATKYATDEQVEALLETGCRDLAESRPQGLWRRLERFPDPEIRWHFIGHLQRNKARRTLPAVWCLHSADSERILEALESTAAELGCRPRVLIEVNISGDNNKQGFAPHELSPLMPHLASFPHLQISGLMGMSSLTGGREQARRDFAALRQLRDHLVKELPPGCHLNELSMGMSEDFDLGIIKGATMVRIGSALFEGTEDSQ